MDEEAGLDRIRVALLGEAFTGITRTSVVYPFGAFQLAGALLDTVAGLAIPKGKQDARFAEFIRRYLPPSYAVGDLPDRLYRGMRCRTLHNYSTHGLLLLDGQAESLHLDVRRDGRTVIRLQNLLSDLEYGLHRWWADVKTDPAVRAAALARHAQYPVITIEPIESGLPLPTVLPATFGPVATAFGGVPMASGAVGAAS
jgi:hypothetical protein